jgi:hypothetical protein
MAQELKNKIVVLEPCTKTVEDLLKTITDRKQAELIRVSIPEEAVQLVRQYQPCMLVVCIHENNELPQRVTLFKNLESSIKYGLLKTLFVSKIKNKQISTLITSLGVTDFMEEPVPLRTLQFKANIQMKAIETIRKQQELKKASQEKIVFKKAGQKEEGEGGGEPQAKPAPALQLDEDAFLFKNSGVKKNGKKTVVELEGPDPASGEWVSHEDKGNAQAAWRWVPEEEKDTPEAKRGDGWIHSGDKPQFQEASQKWQMASEKPDLSYQKDGKKVAKKISTDAAGAVSVAADSPKAEANIKKAKAAGKRAKERTAEKKLLAEQAEQEAKEAKLKAEASPDPLAEKPEPLAKQAAEAGEEPSGPAPLELKGKEAKKAATKEKSAEGAEEPAPVVDLQTHREQKETKKSKGPALNPLEFLQKKKKEKLSKEAPESSAEEKPEKQSDLPAAEEEAPEENKTEKLKVEALEKPVAGKKKNKSAEALDRLRAKLGEGLDKPEEEKVREEIAALELAQEEEEAALAEDPAAIAEEEVPEGEGPAPLLIGEKKKKKAKAPALPGLMGLTPKERKKKVLEEVQAMLAEPLPKELPFEEEKRLREKFGLEDAPEVSPEALARKERLEKVKALKASLLDFDTRQEEESAPEAKTHDLTPEELENTWSQSSGAGRESGVARRAFDSDLSAEEEPEDDSLATSARTKKKEKGEKEDPYFYLPEIELKPIGNAWEKAVEHQVYLSGEIRYRGFAKMQDLLPLWIYKGEQKPELLDKTKQWRFHGALPFSAQTLKEVPADVREFLLGLKAGDREENSAEAEDAEIAEAMASTQEEELPEAADESAAEELIGEDKPRKKSKGLDLAELNASLDKQSDAMSGEPAEEFSSQGDRPVTQADTLEEIFEKKKKSGSITSALSETASSPGIEKFLERRKKKEKAAEPATSAQKSEPTNPYLGILVALSNSFGPAKDSQRTVGRVLKAIELSFGRCTCALLGPPDADGLAPLQIGPGGELGEKMAPEGARPIRMKDHEEILGYLLLKPTGDRPGFTDREEEVIQKVLESIWPALAKGTERKAA